jgi:hypothetical protein
MKLKIKSIENAIDSRKELKTSTPSEDEIIRFKKELNTLVGKIDSINEDKDETEEHLKFELKEFFVHTAYSREDYAINTKGDIDLAIYLGNNTNENVGVIIEAKRPKNKGEMITPDNLNRKAFREAILYYFDEKKIAKNPDLKFILITNVLDWYIINIKDFEPIINNSKFNKIYNKRKEEDKNNTDLYDEFKDLIDITESELPCIHFNIKEYEEYAKKDTPANRKKIINLYKTLSPNFLLKKQLANDSNKLNTNFYKELLHIIGVEEITEGSKLVIKRIKKPNSGSFIENTINILETEDVLRKISNNMAYGNSREEKLYNIALELVLTWINRILFLKLLEGQLINYHKESQTDCRFLFPEKIKDFDELYKLFHQVLARNYIDRSDAIKKNYATVPYLNSSLFEISEIEDLGIKINSLDDNLTIPVYSGTVTNYKNHQINPLKYLLEFLNSYDFGSDKKDDYKSDNLINASVLGKIFEKINGFKDGSFFTPGFVTEYMCKETIEKAVIQKFNDFYKLNCKTLIDVYNERKDKNEVNAIINSLKICDPAVGSGHFLVSALNIIIAVKQYLGVLRDKTGKDLRDYTIEVINDELVVLNDDGSTFQYNPKNIKSQTVQETLFIEKQTIIENCLFGVDINTNSVKICRLRLWIELLKNAYYNKDGNLETLPNIDINIKCGNSLISRFALNSDLKQALKQSKRTIDRYKLAVATYRNAKNKEQKREMENLILSIKQDFSTEIRLNDPLKKRLDKLANELYHRFTGSFLFEPETPYGESEKSLEKRRKLEKEKLEKEIDQINTKFEEIKSNKIYENAFEWSFEFPEVLNDDGDFIGFDLIIGNPPYIRHEEIKDLKPHLEKDFKVFNSTADILTYFFELGNNLLRTNGRLSYIVSNKFFKVSYGEKLRAYLIKNILLEQIIEFDKLNIFESATVKSAIVQFQKTQLLHNHLDLSFTYADISEIPLNLADSVMALGKKYNQSLFNGQQWIFQSEGFQAISNKIEEYGTPLSEWNIEISRGLLTGLNEAFIIEEEAKNKILDESISAEFIIKPLFKGREIDKYFSVASKSYIIATFPSLKLNIDNYPSIKNHLLNFGKSKLEQSGNSGSRKKTSNQWFETQDATAYWAEFGKPKIIWKRIGSKLRFCYDESGTYTLDSTCIATGKHLKYLVGILNSKLIEFELNRFAPKTGTGDLIISVQALSPLRIPIPTEDEENQINDLIDKAILQKKQGSESNEFEQEIDLLVYKLYALDYEEVLLIDADFSITQEVYESKNNLN